MPFLKKMVKQRNSGKRACHCTLTTEESQFTRKLKKTKKKKKGKPLPSKTDVFALNIKERGQFQF